MKNPPPSALSPLTASIPLGFAFIYLAWGGTYLGVKFAVTDIPVFLMSGGRFFVAGLLLLLGIALLDRKAFHLGTFREWSESAVIGILLLVFGIGAGNWAQQYVDSSFAAMVFSGLPLWIILIDWLRPGGRAPTVTVASGLLLGFIGIGIILLPSGVSGAKQNIGVDLILVGASISWASGAILSRFHKALGSPLLPVARQMIAAGAVLIGAGLLHGDVGHLHLADVRWSSWIGFAYLVFIGSLGGYPVYIWLMRVCPPAKAATVPYVNLLVALFLGWSLGHENITARLLVGSSIVLSSVTVVLRGNQPT